MPVLASESLYQLRAKAQLHQRTAAYLESLRWGMMIGAAITILVGFPILASGSMAAFIAVLAFVTAVGTGIVWPYQHRKLEEIYSQARLILNETDLAKLIVEEDFIQVVLETVNVRKKMIFPQQPPKTLEAQLRFAARYWRDFLYQMSGSDATTSKTTDFVALVFRDYSVEIEAQRSYPRLRAICDFFLNEGLSIESLVTQTEPEKYWEEPGWPED